VFVDTKEGAGKDAEEQVYEDACQHQGRLQEDLSKAPQLPPGILREKTLDDMVDRFDTIFGVPMPNRSEKVKKKERIMEHLRKHTKRRRGDAVPPDYIEWEQTSKIYELFCTKLNIFERIFFTVDVGESSSILSTVCSFFLIFMIFVSIAFWMVSTLPSMQNTKWCEDCDCSSTETGECPPAPHPMFMWVEAVCVITFTVEYFVRLFTVHSVRFALLDEYFLEAVLTGEHMVDVKAKHHPTESHGSQGSIEKSQSHMGEGALREEEGKGEGMQGCSYPRKLDSKLKTTFNHLIGFSNVIDLLAILPFWLEKMNIKGGGGFLVVLRILRLTRIFRVFKLGKYNDVFAMFTGVVNQSMPALFLMLFFICLGCCLFGTLVWFAEQGTWYPEGNPTLSLLTSGGVPSPIVGRGAWLRHDGSKDPEPDCLEESPFQSIIHSFWYVIVTITTVGYGDVSPTTPEGKIVATVAILNGIIVLAMPIGVVGANFSEQYYHVIDEQKKRQRKKQQLESTRELEEQEDAATEPKKGDAGGETAETDKKTLRIDVARTLILVDAEGLDNKWQQDFPAVLHQELSEHLRSFMDSFIPKWSADRESSAPESADDVSKPKIQMARLLDLDALAAHVNTVISTVTSADDFAEFGLKEAYVCRRKWQEFVSKCWEYATEMCQLEKMKAPPEVCGDSSNIPEYKMMMKERERSKATAEQGASLGSTSDGHPGDTGSQRLRSEHAASSSRHPGGDLAPSPIPSPPSPRPDPPQVIGSPEADHDKHPEITGSEQSGDTQQSPPHATGLPGMPESPCVAQADLPLSPDSPKDAQPQSPHTQESLA
jgi:hypothetical protein